MKKGFNANVWLVNDMHRASLQIGSHSVSKLMKGFY